jgi:hypothetical protein
VKRGVNALNHRFRSTGDLKLWFDAPFSCNDVCCENTFIFLNQSNIVCSQISFIEGRIAEMSPQEEQELTRRLGNGGIANMIVNWFNRKTTTIAK